jgi:hypothetical protein
LKNSDAERDDDDDDVELLLLQQLQCGIKQLIMWILFCMQEFARKTVTLASLMLG